MTFKGLWNISVASVYNNNFEGTIQINVKERATLNSTTFGTKTAQVIFIIIPLNFIIFTWFLLLSQTCKFHCPNSNQKLPSFHKHSPSNERALAGQMLLNIGASKKRQSPLYITMPSTLWSWKRGQYWFYKLCMYNVHFYWFQQNNFRLKLTFKGSWNISVASVYNNNFIWRHNSN